MQLGIPTGYIFSNLKFGDNDKNLKEQNELFNKYALSARNFIAKRLLSKQDDLDSYNSDVKDLNATYKKIKDYKPTTVDDLKKQMEDNKIISDKTKEEKLRNELQQIKTDTEMKLKNEQDTYDKDRKDYLDNQNKEKQLREEMGIIQKQKEMKEIDAIDKETQDKLDK